MANKIIIIDKQCNITEKKSTINKDNLYKLVGLKNNNHFDHRHTWKVTIDNKKMNIMIYSKDDGNHNHENKYDLPPPVDNDLYFGKILIIGMDHNDNYIDLTTELWETIYEKLFGGFEDLATTAIEDENESDELEDYSDSEITNSGYLKDGFVVDDDELDFEEYENED
jgi:hypothetical protein